MSENGYRWVMTAPREPLVKTAFDPFPPAAGEVVVAVAGCGMCHSDLGFYYGDVRTNHALPLALGHEVSGHVVATGNGAEQWMDQTVLVPAVLTCGKCDACQRGRGTICPNQQMPGNDIQGGFASHIVVSSYGLCPLDEDRLAAVGMTLPDASVVADAVTTPYQAVLQAGGAPGSLAIGVGVGGIGSYAVQMANAFGATVVAVDIDPAKLDAIAEHGAALALNSRDLPGRDLRQAIQSFAKDKGLPTTEWFIFECSGTADGQVTAYGLLNRGATLGIVGFTREKAEFRLSNLMAFHARAMGNWGCPPELYPQALAMVLEGSIKVAPFVEQHPLSDINKIFATVHAGEMKRRAVLIPDA